MSLGNAVVRPLRGIPGKARGQHLIFCPHSLSLTPLSPPNLHPHSDTSALLLQFHVSVPLDLIITNSVLAGLPARAGFSAL